MSSWKTSQSTSVPTCKGRHSAASKSPPVSFAWRTSPVSGSWASHLIGRLLPVGGGLGTVYELVDGLNGTAQRIRTRSGVAGIETPVFLPLHRIETYDFSVHVRFTRGTSRSAALRLQVWLAGGVETSGDIHVHTATYGLDRGGPMSGDEPDRLLGEETIDLGRPHLGDGRWQKVRCVLRVSRGGVPKGARFKLRMLVQDLDQIDLDSAELFPTDALYGWDPEVVQLLREMKTSVLRFPGGNFSSGYHWKEGVGPVEQRPEKPNPAWPEWESNRVGTDEWLTLCELIGAEPMICVNAGNGTPEDAADWVRYCNDPETTEWGRRAPPTGTPLPTTSGFGKWGTSYGGAFRSTGLRTTSTVAASPRFPRR